jgi:hypothetical protein
MAALPAWLLHPAATNNTNLFYHYRAMMDACWMGQHGALLTAEWCNLSSRAGAEGV